MFLNGYITEYCQLTKLSDPTTAGTSAVDSGSVDMAANGGCDGVLIFTSYGTAASGNVIKAQQSSDDGVVDDYSDIAGEAVAVSTSDEDQWLDIQRPGKRYVRIEAARGTSSALGDIWAVKYKFRNLPVSALNQVTGTIVGEAHASDAEGTA